MLAGPVVSASAITTMTASKISISPTTARTACIEITAMALSPMSPKRLDCASLAPAFAQDGLSSITSATAGSVLFVASCFEIDLATAPKPSMQVPNCNFEGVPTNCGPGGLAMPYHSLYRNNGDGTFTDVSKDSGIAALRTSYGFTSVA